MKITYYGHCCFSVLANGKNILFDPFIKSSKLAKNVNEIKADYIFISQIHCDHVLDIERIAKNTGAKVIGNFEIYSWLQKNGIANAHTIISGGKFDFDFGTVKCVGAQDSDSFIDGSHQGVACGFVFKTVDGNFYYSGDKALTSEMQLIYKFSALDFAVFPVGDGLTMGIEEVIDASEIVQVEHGFRGASRYFWFY